MEMIFVNVGLRSQREMVTQAEAAMGLKAAKNRKIYNGMMKTYFYQFPGPKPPKAK